MRQILVRDELLRRRYHLPSGCHKPLITCPPDCWWRALAKQTCPSRRLQLTAVQSPADILGDTHTSSARLAYNRQLIPGVEGYCHVKPMRDCVSRIGVVSGVRSARGRYRRPDLHASSSRSRADRAIGIRVFATVTCDRESASIGLPYNTLSG